MNRLTNAFAAAIPSSASDASSTHVRESSAAASPIDASFPPTARSSFEPSDRATILQSLIYDDPRGTHPAVPERMYYPSRLNTSGSDGMLSQQANGKNTPTPTPTPGSGSGPNGGTQGGLAPVPYRRPGLLRHVSENAVSFSSRSGGPTPRVGYGPDRTVRADLMGGKRGRLEAMVKGPEGRYAVGGGQYLRVLQISSDSSGAATPVPDKERSPRPKGVPMAKGLGGVSVNEVVNLWKGNWGSSKGVNDIDWGVGAYEGKIATATPCGNFMLFDVNKGKLEKDTFSGHPRPLNCAKFCKIPSYGHLLITGSTEGTAKIWDLRDREATHRKQFRHSCALTAVTFSPDEPHAIVVATERGTIKRYDVRYANRAMGAIYGAHGLRPVFDLKWKGGHAEEGPGSAGWLASAGADRTVQVWDMAASWDKNPTPTHTLHTAYPLRRVSWCPGNDTELVVVPIHQPVSSAADPSVAKTKTGAEASADEDAHIEVWDVRRHYIAKYAMATSDGPAADIAWGDDPQTMVACFQTGVLAQIDTRNRHLPIEEVPRQVMSWSVSGEMAYALDRFKAGEVPFDDLKPEYADHWHKVGKKPKSVADPPYEPLQAVGSVPLPEADSEEFSYLAQHYRLDGDAPENLCQWNREVAEMCGRHDDARLWSFLRVLVEEFSPSSDHREFNEAIFSEPPKPTSQVPTPPDLSPRGDSAEFSLSPDRPDPARPTFNGRAAAVPIALERGDDHLFDTSSDLVEELLDETPSASSSSGSATPQKGRFRAFLPPDARRISEARTSISTVVPPNTRNHSGAALPRSDSTTPRTSSSSSDEQTRRASDKLSSSMIMTSTAKGLYDWPDPYGIAPSTSGSSRASSSASPLPWKVEERPITMTTQSAQPATLVNGGTLTSVNGPGPVSGMVAKSILAPRGSEESARRTSGGGPPVQAPFKGKVDLEAEAVKRYRQRRCQLLLDWWQSYVEEGEVQLATTVFIVGSCVVQFPKKQCERIAHAYLDLLDRHRLAIPAAYIRRHAAINSLETYAQDVGMTHVAHCQRCGKPTGNLEDIGRDDVAFWWCKRCRMGARTCAICHESVKGLWMGCGKCHHGGHQRCMRFYYMDAELVSSSVGTTAKASSAAQPSTPVHSGFQRSQSSIPSTSLDSSGFVIDKARTSGEGYRDGVGAAAQHRDREEESAPAAPKWNHQTGIIILILGPTFVPIGSPPSSQLDSLAYSNHLDLGEIKRVIETERKTGFKSLDIATRRFASVAEHTSSPFHTSHTLSNPAIPLAQSPIMSSPFPPTPPLPKASGPVDLLLPPTEDRPHKYFTLPNGLEVIVVSDPKADKAAASMDVGVGHLSDPDDLPGCAHFCEHLLFMGTKTYPSENEYQSYLNSHNGGSNAWTAMTSTTYFFDVSADALEGALDRFSGFFFEPLFNEDCTEREIKAVDSEHKKNLQADMWRFFQLEKHAMRADHAYHKFGTGNYTTLWSKPKEAGRDPRQQLIEWWEKNYCARRMKLAVVGREDVETLEKWVQERFEKVPVRTEGLPPTGVEGVRVTFDESPMGPEQMGVVTFTKPVKDNRGLEITFPFPDLSHLFECKPTNYVTHFLGHEGKGSILSYLKHKGWSNYLRAGMSHGSAGFDFFKITVDLTPDGLKHWRDVALVIFKYISLLRSQPPSSTAFDEIKTMADISFRFAEKHRPDDYCTELTGGMQEPVPRDRIVSSKYVMEKWNPDEVVATLQLLDPRRAAIGLTCKEVPADVGGDFDLKEPIYGTEYKQTRLSDQFLKDAVAGAPIPELNLPPPNPFIPKRLDVEKFEVQEKALRPDLLKDTPLSRLWYKRDDTWWLPKTNVDIKLTSPLLTTTPRNHVLTTLLTEMFSDSVTEETYEADLAELSFRFYQGGEWIGIMARGFSDKLAVFTETMLGKLMQFEVNEGRFNEVVDQLKLHWGNFKLNEPYRQIGFWDAYVAQPVAWTQEERLAELEHITPDDVKAFGKEVFRRLYIETLIHGNTTAEGANEIQEMVERVLAPRPLAEAEKLGSRTLILPPSSEHIWAFDVPNASEVNGAVTYSLHIGDITDHALRARLQLFGQIVNEPAFDRLRTKEQLGYIVSTSTLARTGSQGFRVMVQSERDPVYVETRIEAFLDSMRAYIEELSEEEYAKHVQSLVQKREEKAKNLGEETRRFWGRIVDMYYEFGKRQAEIAYLKQTTKADVLSLLNTYIHTSSPTRSKLSVHMRSQYRGIKFDPASAAQLVEAFTKHSIPVDQSALTALIASAPDLDKVKAFAIGAVKAAEGLGKEAQEEVTSLIEGLQGKESGVKSEEERNAKVREGNVWIEDVQLFKAGLVPSKAAVPMEPIKQAAKL